MCFKDDQGFARTTRVYTNYATGGVNFVLDMAKSSGVADTIFVTSRRYVVSGSNIAVDVERNTNISNGVYPTVATATNFKIYAVYGNKY